MSQGGHFVPSGHRMTSPEQYLDEAVGDHVAITMDGDFLDIRCRHCAWEVHFGQAWTQEEVIKAWVAHMAETHGELAHA